MKKLWLLGAVLSCLMISDMVIAAMMPGATSWLLYHPLCEKNAFCPGDSSNNE